MGKGGSAKQQVNRYHMSIHLGVCAALDAITGIFIGEKEAWSGDVANETAIGVNRVNLFGGDKKEGGVQGIAYYLPGDSDQVLPNGLAARRGLTSSTSPAYRGLASVYFVGSLTPGSGFYWGATPYIQPAWIRGRRAPKGLDPEYAMIGNRLSVAIDDYQVTIGATTADVLDGVSENVGGHTVSVSIANSDATTTLVIDGLTIIVQPFILDDEGEQQPGTTVTVAGSSGEMVSGSVTLAGVTVTQQAGGVLLIEMGEVGQDANPAHIIFECLTNTGWGMGASLALIDADNFEAVGRVLFHEGFGMSLLWARENTIEAFVGEVLDHIQAALYIDPESGRFTLKLFRDDYAATSLPVIDPDNAVLDNFQRKLWGETVNEIVVTWTNPINEQDETVIQQDLGNIVLQGATVSDSRNYYGVRNAELAAWLAARDVRQSSAPLASVDALLDRSSWNLAPGSVVRLNWPEYQIENLVMRVMAIDYGKIGSPSITVTLLEDIFSLARLSVQPGAGSGFVDEARDPTPMDHVSIITAPAYFTSRYLSSADAGALTYPDVLVSVLGASSNPDAGFYELVGQAVLPNGTTIAEERGTKGLLGWATLSAPLAAEASSLIPSFGLVSNGIGPVESGFVFIGDGSEQTMEIALIEAFDDDGWRLQRGVLDTVPTAWPSGTSLWFYDIRNDFIDPDLHSEGEAVAYKLLTMTSLGKLAVGSSPIYGTNLSARPHLPNRPARVRIAGIAFGPVDLTGITDSTIPIVWVNRNRTLEDTTVLKWTDSTVTPEPGQTTRISLHRTDDSSEIVAFTDIPGTSYDLPVTAFDGEFEADVRVAAMRDGLRSLQYTTRRVRIAEDPDGSAIGEPPEPDDEPYEPPPDYPDPQPPPPFCVISTAQVLLANGDRTGPGTTVAGGLLRPYEDWVWTRHAETGRWGAFLVTSVHRVVQPVYFAPGYPRATARHQFQVDDAWTTIDTIGTPDGTAEIVQLTVDDAMTFVTVQSDGSWIVSHNRKPLPDFQ